MTDRSDNRHGTTPAEGRVTMIEFGSAEAQAIATEDRRRERYADDLAEIEERLEAAKTDLSDLRDEQAILRIEIEHLESKRERLLGRR